MGNINEMENKKVLVTGSGTGIGQGIAIEFAKRGAAVVLHYCRNDKGAKSVVEQIRNMGREAEAFKADFNFLNEVYNLGDKAVNFLNGLDVLVNNSGISMNKPFLETTPEQFETLYNVNVKSSYFLTQRLAPILKRSFYPSVINISSVNAYGGLREFSVYAGTKAAIIAQSRVMAVELSGFGIRVNVIAPGWIKVKQHWAVLTKDENFNEENAGENLPLGFVGSPEDVANLAIFLASEKSRYITGQSFVIDGGQLAVLPCTGDFHEPFGQQFGKGYLPDV